ncbi:hypothetical protein NM208_g16314 [Fusarium decemcellulare]|uniref:Uncharacterized protein n=1 Tax=Fusarium decemcellulare TaxID=57161 RepID=A0ACC1RAI6_9HYPO|nr:hypothetical protein NM208_g16314 [Fusarium decemcellulare]
MATNTPNVVLPDYPDRDHSIREASVAIAVDVSSSTSGPALAAEKKLVSRIAKRLSPKSQLSSLILPWSGTAHDCLGLNSVDTLTPQLMTRPVAILENKTHLAALSRSSLWLLLTDGEVSDRQRTHFARKIPMTGLHGTASITVVVQSRHEYKNKRPALCDISVGVSVYALSPNCLFLFCDTSSNHLFILQAKGAFKSLLKGADNPVLDSSTTWNSLPRLSLDDLVKVAIPVPKRLETHQIALQDSLIVNINDLLSDKLSPDAVTRILADDDNLGSIIMTLQSRNQNDAFQEFINRQAIALGDPLFQKREDIDGQAVGIYTELCEAFHQNKSQRHLYRLQEQLRRGGCKRSEAGYDSPGFGQIGDGPHQSCQQSELHSQLRRTRVRTL